MHLNSKTRSLLILAVTAGACSRTLFAFIDDPEGPNLLVVTGMAAIIWALSLTFYLPKILPSLTGLQRVAATVVIQIIIATGFCLGLR